MLTAKQKRITELARSKSRAGQELIAVGLAGPPKTKAEAEDLAVRKALARAAWREAERELERLIEGGV